MPTTAQSPEEFATRFWSKVTKTAECWIWTGARTGAGYGNLKHRGKTLFSHRVSYAMAYGSLADSAVILHRCDTPACVRPDHLVSGTQRENIRDCTNKRRNRREGTRSTKLSADSVRKIRTEYDRGDTQQILAARYGMSQTGISHIVLRKTWSWVE